MTRFLLSLFCISLLVPNTVEAHEHEGAKSAEEAKIISLDDDFSVVQAGGGNILVLKTDEGLFVVDNGLADKSAVVTEAFQSLSDKPVKYLVNTHWHFDHAGNNEIFGKKDTILIASDNVRTRLEEGGTIEAFDKVLEPAPKEALPVITYDKSVNVYLGAHQAKIQKLKAAHTDGDSLIYFERENILHTGDIFFNGFFPFIDASSGGSLKGMTEAVDVILNLVDADTKIIPGHGPVANKTDLEEYQAMLKTVLKRLENAKAEEKTLEEWKVMEPLKDLDTTWGGGFLPTGKFTEIVWSTI